MLEKLIKRRQDDSQSGVAGELLAHVKPCLQLADKVLGPQKRDEDVPAIVHSVRMVRALSHMVPYDKFEKQPEEYYALAADDCLHDTWETIARDGNNTQQLRQDIYNLGIGGEDYLIDVARVHANENMDPVPVQGARMLSNGQYRKFRLLISKLTDIYDNSKTSRSFAGEDKAIKRFLKASFYMDWVLTASDNVINSAYSHLLDVKKVIYMRDITLNNLSCRKMDYAEQIKAARIN